MKVMLVDDEESLHLQMTSLAAEEGWGFCGTCDSREALSLFERERPDAVVLDVMMPRVDGFEVCRRIRVSDPDVPVLFLSAKGDIVDKRTGFTNGGDDYLVKPFVEEELVIRLEALMRRARRSVERTGGSARGQGADGTGARRAAIGPFEFDPARHRLTKTGNPVSLTPKEYDLLYTLASEPGKVMSKEELIEAVWGREYLDGAISIAVYVRNLRKKIEDDPARPSHLLNEWGVGYRFEA